MTEAGYPEVNVVPWYGFAVPAGVPKPIVDKINAAFNEALRDPAVLKRLEQQALQSLEPMSPEQIAKIVEQDTEKYAKVIRDANIKLND